MEQTPVSPRFTGLLGFNAGYVDTAGFLALNGLFTAHVTGNFVTLGAAFVHGTTGAFAKLLALPLFCAVVVLTRLFASGLAAADTAIQTVAPTYSRIRSTTKRRCPTPSPRQRVTMAWARASP